MLRAEMDCGCCRDDDAECSCGCHAGEHETLAVMPASLGLELGPTPLMDEMEREMWAAIHAEDGLDAARYHSAPVTSRED